MMNRKAGAAMVLFVSVGTMAQGATLVQQYNFDNYTTGTTYSPNVGTVGVIGGNLSGNATNLVTGTGPSGVAGTDKALVNVGVNNNPTGSSMAGSNDSVPTGTFTEPADNQLNLGSLSQFTVTMWINKSSTNNAGTGTNFPRLIMAGTKDRDLSTAGVNGFGIALNNGLVEARVKQYGGVVTGSTVANDTWQFIAVSYDGLAVNPYFSLAQQAANGAQTNDDNVQVYLGTAATAAVGVGGLGADVGGSVSPGAIDLSSANNTGFVYLLNGASLVRGFNGLADDFRIYDGLMTVSEIEAVRASAVPEPASLGLLSLVAVSLIRRRRA